MKKYLLLFFLLWISGLQADEEIDFPKPETSRKIFDTRENYFLTSTDYKIKPKVNPITGHYCEEELDLVVAGSQPLSARRFYNSEGPYDPRYASWRYNPETFMAANFELNLQEIFAAFGERDGSLISLKPSSQADMFQFPIADGFIASCEDGKGHPLHKKITYWKKQHQKDGTYFQYIGTITDGSGRIREFVSPMHRWNGSVIRQEKTLWKNIKCDTYPNTWTPYHIPIVEEKLPNGNIICYTYADWKPADLNYPRPQLLSSITAYNHDKSQILGSIRFNYLRTEKNEVEIIQVIGSDNRKANIVHKGTSPIVINVVEKAAPRITYGWEDRYLNTISRPDGRVATIDWNADKKVTAQNAPVGPNNEMCPIARYEYQDKLTICYDAENHKTHYRYDDDKRLTSIETFQGYNLYRIDRFNWDSSGNLSRKTVEDSSGTPVQITEYQYDKNQNPILERIGDGNEWRTIERTYSDDGFNLKLSESDRECKRICYSYVPHTNLLASELTYENDAIRKRIFHFYDSCAICIKTIIDDGATLDPENLQGVSFRKITYVTPKKNRPCFGLPEIVEEKTIESGKEVLLHKIVYTYAPSGQILREDHFDANEVHHHCISNAYDIWERLISTTDPLGNTTHYKYDANFNVTELTGQKQHKEIAYDKVNRPIRIKDKQSDGTILVTDKKYDKLGQLVEEIDACRNSTLINYDALGRVISVCHPDGAIETREYDLLNNVIKEIDPKGYETKRDFNCFGQPTSIYYPDGSEEHFTYNPTGTLLSKTDKNGCTICYKYDIFDQPIEETWLIENSVLKMLQATWSPFCKLKSTDAEGNTTFYIYDFSGRKVAETTGTKKTSFVYNSIGLLEKTECDYFHQIELHDKAGQLISKTLLSDEAQFQEGYLYDEAGNCTHRVTSRGAFETIYNNLGKPLVEINPKGHKTTHAYSFDGRFCQTTTDANNIRTTRIHDSRNHEIACIKTNSSGKTLSKCENAYDLCGNLITQTHYVYGPELIKTVTHNWEYGPMGRLERFIEAGQKQTRYLYDSKGRLKTLIKPSGIQIEYEYDPLGRLKHYFSKDFDYQYAYDRNDRLLSVHDAVSGTTTTRTYNAFGNVTNETIDKGLQFHNKFDHQGRRTQLTLPDGSDIKYGYHGAYLHDVNRNGNQVTYKTRDLEGCLLELDFPVGEISIKRDSLSRISTIISPCYSSVLSFDPVGNLVQCELQDPLGAKNCHYVYDELNQLVSENEHAYSFDSLHNRLKKDDAVHVVNEFSEILKDGNKDYEYDLDGNLIFDGTWKYIYDSLDRLIALEKEKERIEYTYDSFHRRLTKTVLSNGTRLFERYLWDDNNEIGTINEKGKITQLRVLGEGLGAEIGAAVLFELNGKTYFPIHDHRGNLAVLLDSNKNCIETCRYTAFGEELAPFILSPWRFSSKRFEQETGLVFFGRRYYLPTLGRWVTQDPQGFNDGPNLYAYLSNCPLIAVDPYGLRMTPCNTFCSHVFGGLVGLAYSYWKNGFDYSYEDCFSNKSRCFGLNESFKTNFPEPKAGAYFFGNGVRNQFNDLKANALMVTQFSGHNTRGVYNASHGLFMDGAEALANLYLHAKTPPVEYYIKQWDNYFDNDTSGAPILQFAHSQGTAQLRNALEMYPKERRDRIIVAAYAPLAYIPKELCMKVTHYVCPSDPIPQIDYINKRNCEDTIIYVPKIPNSRQWCHEFSNPIYGPYMEREIKYYQNLLNDYEN